MSFFIISLLASDGGYKQGETTAAFTCDVNIIASSTEPCGLEPIIFQIENPDPTLTYRWNFGDPDAEIFNPTGVNNNTATGEFVMHAFSTSDTGDVFIISVIAYDDSNVPCSSDFIKVTTKSAPQAVLFDDNGTEFLNCPTPTPDIFRLIVSNRNIGNGADFYRIEWGDGSPDWESTTPPDFLQHDYDIGAFELVYTVFVDSLECQSSSASYLIYNGTDPDLGLSINGRTNICIPGNITFNILNTENNTAGTLYYITINDGSGTQVFNQSTIPSQLVHVFDSISCGTISKTEIDAYELSIKAENPCGKKEADIRPIKVGRAPTAKMNVEPAPVSCDATIFTFRNVTDDGIDFRDNLCSDLVSSFWTITPLDGGSFNYIFGRPNRDSIQIEFEAGEYLVTLETRNNCGVSTTQEIIKVIPTPKADFAIAQSNTCTPVVVDLENLFIEFNSRSGSLPKYKWTFEYTPSDCQASNNEPLIFLEGDTTNPRIKVEILEPGQYSVRLDVENACGGAFFEDTLIISGAPFATISTLSEITCDSATLDFRVDNISGCNQDPEFLWSFPGAIPNSFEGVQPEGIFFPGPGVYPIEMLIRNGCDATPARDTIVIYESTRALARANFSPQSRCIPVDLDLSNFSTGDDVEYLWEISPSTGWNLLENTSLTDAEPKIRFNEIGQYKVTLTTTNPCGSRFWEDEFLIIDEPEVNLDAIADFCDTAALNPVANFNFLPMIEEIIWEFPGGSIDSFIGPDPGTVFYDTAGTYTVKITVINECGIDTDEKTFKVLEKGEVNVQMDTVACLPNSILRVSNQTFGDSLEYSWEVTNISNPTGRWFFTDNTTAKDYEPAFEFQDTGQYKVSLRIISQACEERLWEETITIFEEPTVEIEPVDDFCESGSIIPRLKNLKNIGRIDSVRWEFPGGDINVSNSLQPPAINYDSTGFYEIRVFIFNRCGASSDTTNFKILEPISALPSLNSNIICQGDTLRINNSLSGDSLSYSWSVQGPSANFEIFDSAQIAPRFYFPDTGLYTIQFNVFSPSCPDFIWESEVLVSQPPSVELAPITEICADSATIQPVFSAISDTSRIDSIKWVYRDRNNNLMVKYGFSSPEITYDSTGSYPIIATVFNPCGTDSDTFVYNFFKAPIALARLDSNIACLGETVIINNLSVGENLSYNWSIEGMGRVNINDSTAFEPRINFLDTGQYTIKLLVTNLNCNDFEWEEQIFINEAPNIQLAPIPNLCEEIATVIPKILSISDTSLIDSIRWQFPGASNIISSSSFTPPTLVYDSSGSYNISVTVYNSCNTISDNVNFQFYSTPVAGALLDTNFICIGDILGVQNLSIGDDLEYLWRAEHLDKPGAAPPDINTPNSAEPIFTFLDTGRYKIILEVSNPLCSGIIWEDSILVSQGPTVDLEPIQDFCELAIITPKANYSDTSRIDSVQWFFPDGQPSFSSEWVPENIEYRNFGMHTITVKVFNACGVDSSSQQFYLDPTPTISLSQRDTFCWTDGVFQIPGPSPAGGYWRGSPAIIDSIQGLYDPSIIAGTQLEFGRIDSIEYVYQLRACEVSALKEIFVVDLGFIDAGPLTNTCISDDQYVLGGAIPEGGWYSGPGIIDSTGIFAPSDLGIGNYILTYYFQLEGTDCIASDTFIVSVNLLPTAGIGENDNICVGNPVTFENTSTGGAQYTWYIQNQNGSFSIYNEFEATHTFEELGFHNVKLVVESSTGCRDSITTEFFVSGATLANFEIDTKSGCAPLEVNFVNNSISYRFTEYIWDFGNGQTSRSYQPDPVIFEQGFGDTTYVISLTVRNSCHESVFVDSVTIFPTPIPRPILSEDFGCEFLEVIFDNATLGLPESFEWSITHNGVTTVFSRDSIPPPQIFTADSTLYEYYYVNLKAFNQCGDSTVTKEIIIKPKGVQAQFRVDTTQGCEPFNVDFINFTAAPDEFVDFTWYFGDQDSLGSKNANYTFYAENDTITDHKVTLVAENITSRDSFSIFIKVFPTPKLSIVASDTICPLDSVPFYSLSENVGDFIWDFGDGSEVSTDSAPQHLYETAGIYTVSLSGRSIPYGCPVVDTLILDIKEVPKPAFSVGNYFGCPPLEVTLENQTDNALYYIWDFGDGNTSVEENPNSHIYTESGLPEIRLTAIDEKGCASDTAFNLVEVYPEPTAGFDILEEDDCGLPRNICINNTTSGASGFEWDFDNGEQSDLNNPCIEYTENGNFTIDLIAKNEYLCADTISKDYLAAGLPMADFQASVLTGCEPLIVDFTNLSENADEYFWIFSDQPLDTIRSINPQRTFEEAGVYSVTLLIKNGRDCRDSITYEDLIVVHPTPNPSITFDKLDNELPVTYQFIVNTNAKLRSTFWNFGDGQTSQLAHPRHRYINFVPRTITLEVETPFGCIGKDTVNMSLDTITNLSIPNILEPRSEILGQQVFQPKGISLVDYHIAIYSRNGTLVWESTALDEEGRPTEHWDGTLQRGAGAGTMLPAGVYVWEVKRAVFVDGTIWDGMNDKNGVPRKSNFVYLIR